MIRRGVNQFTQSPHFKKLTVEGEAMTTRLLEKLSYVSLIIAALVVSGSAVYDRAIVRSEGRA